MTALIFIFVPIFTFYLISKLIFGPDIAAHHARMMIAGTIVLLLVAAVSLLLAPIFGDSRYFHRVDKDIEFAMVDAYWDWMDKDKDRAFAWLFFYPYIAVFDLLFNYVKIIVLHFKFHYLLTHGAGFFIMWVFRAHSLPGEAARIMQRRINRMH